LVVTRGRLEALAGPGRVGHVETLHAPRRDEQHVQAVPRLHRLLRQHAALDEGEGVWSLPAAGASSSRRASPALQRGSWRPP